MMTNSACCIALLSIVVLGCGEARDETDAAGADTAAVTAAPPAGPVLSDTTGEAAWAFLQSANYRQWQKWPGKGELYKGTEPHGMLLTTYVNALAHDALTNGSATMPDGAVVVKENYMADSTLAAVTTMVKRAGYNPEHNDWFFAKHDAQGKVDGAGRVAMCQQCHSTRKAQDYLMTPRPGEATR